MVFNIDGVDYDAYDFIDCYVFIASLQYKLQDLNKLEPYEVKFLMERADELRIKKMFRIFFYTDIKNKRGIRKLFQNSRVINLTDKCTYKTLKDLSVELNMRMTVLDDHIRNKIKIQEKTYIYTQSLYKKIDA